MQGSKCLLAICVVAAVFVAGCGDDKNNTPAPDTSTLDAADTAMMDTASDDASADTAADTATNVDTGGDVTPPDPASVFTIRTPVVANVDCGNGTSESIPQLDWVCDVNYEGNHLLVYLQTTQTTCFTFGFGAEHSVDGAWYWQDGAVVPLEQPHYDHGGNHNNDFISFVFGGQRWTLNHSTFGFGFRKCQPPDCLQIYALDGNIVLDGCEPTRSLPVVCVQVAEDGTVPELADHFALCPGDPDGP